MHNGTAYESDYLIISIRDWSDLICDLITSHSEHNSVIVLTTAWIWEHNSSDTFVNRVRASNSPQDTFCV